MTDLAKAEHAITERGRPVHYTEGTVDVSLKLLAFNGGVVAKTVRMLADEGIDVNRETLRRWREDSFPRRYQQIRSELAQDVSEDVAGRALERALEADDATHAYLKAAKDKIDLVSPTHLAKNAAALAQATAQSVQTAQLLRDRPTAILESRSLGELVGTLEKLGVAERDENVIDVDILSEEDVV